MIQKWFRKFYFKSAVIFQLRSGFKNERGDIFWSHQAFKEFQWCQNSSHCMGCAEKCGVMPRVIACCCFDAFFLLPQLLADGKKGSKLCMWNDYLFTFRFRQNVEPKSAEGAIAMHKLRRQGEGCLPNVYAYVVKLSTVMEGGGGSKIFKILSTSFVDGP